MTSFLQTVSDNLPEEFSHLRFTPVLCGSMAEGTKCYQPDELDFICNLNILGIAEQRKEINYLLSESWYKFTPTENNTFTASSCQIDVLNLSSDFYTRLENALKFLNKLDGQNLSFKALQIGEKLSKIIFS